MFTVYEKGIWENDERAHTSHPKAVDVYAVREDKNGYPHFLICENGEWKYRSAKYYTNNPSQYAWHDEDDYPEVLKKIIVRDSDGNEYDDHYWDGFTYCTYSENDDGTTDGWCSDVAIEKWKYKEY